MIRTLYIIYVQCILYTVQYKYKYTQLYQYVMKSNLEVDILCARVLTFPFPHFHFLAARCLDWIGN